MKTGAILNILITPDKLISILTSLSNGEEVEVRVNEGNMVPEQYANLSIPIDDYEILSVRINENDQHKSENAKQRLLTLRLRQTTPQPTDSDRKIDPDL